MAEVAGFVVSDLLRLAKHSVARLTHADLRQPFVNVFQLRVPFPGQVGILLVILQQGLVMLEVRTLAPADQ
ncbi:MAG: hypothetical protein QGG00_04365 [Verrucomicrobiota bacterium]|nr:hypothetical protein [Verrucomicrobiota bacterium]